MKQSTLQYRKHPLKQNLFAEILENAIIIFFLPGRATIWTLTGPMISGEPPSETKEQVQVKYFYYIKIKLCNLQNILYQQIHPEEADTVIPTLLKM